LPVGSLSTRCAIGVRKEIEDERRAVPINPNSSLAVEWRFIVARAIRTVEKMGVPLREG